jgi:hypothetical protein
MEIRMARGDGRRRGGATTLWELADELRQITQFTDAATAACAASLACGAELCRISLHREDGEPGLVVESGESRDEQHEHELPLADGTRWFGTIAHRRREPFSIVTEHEVVVLATYLSLWCIDRGIGPLIAPVPDVRLGVSRRGAVRIRHFPPA